MKTKASSEADLWGASCVVLFFKRSYLRRTAVQESCVF
jgi:hypothetical protein